jgi:hypothetical protein
MQEDQMPPELVMMLEIEAKEIINRLEKMPGKEALSIILYILSNYVYDNVDKDKHSELIQTMAISCQTAFARWQVEDGIEPPALRVTSPP